ncbi:MAG: hypothetical protein M0C28_23385 [Candidatus Moduliflexus flocculans]|nr:hypothetical protein [Candidatus Moduliflexus flocculans]
MARGEGGRGRPDLRRRRPFPEGRDWFDRLYAREPGLLKVVLEPGRWERMPMEELPLRPATATGRWPNSTPSALGAPWRGAARSACP